MTLSEMRQILAEDDIQLTKSLGQNFLHDANQLRRIVAAGAVTRNDKVLEIGPGLGPLTELLLAGAGEVEAIELDARLVAILRRRFPDAEDGGASRARLTLRHDDALDFLKHNPRDWTGWKLVANLPYSVGSPILVELALAERGPDRMVATLQLEVVQRLTAATRSEHYGLLTLLVGLNYESRGWFKIPGGCFFPAPDVDSACITLVRRDRPAWPAGFQKTFVRLVKLAFGQRRKMMFKLLKAAWPVPELENAFEQTGIDRQIRAEAVSLPQFEALAQCLTPPAPADECETTIFQNRNRP